MITRQEYCFRCKEDTKHSVKIERRKQGDSELSRVPTRVTICRQCGLEEAAKVRR